MGISCVPQIEKQLQNVATFKTVISQISKVEKGDSIGYSRKYIAEKDTRIATIPIGYADGIPRDEVIIFNSCKTLEEFADYCHTIPYEVLTSISRRVKRIYVKD